jgi:predicted nucleic acid-binding protein
MFTPYADLSMISGIFAFALKAQPFSEWVNVDMERTRQRAETFFSAGFGVADAAHVAFSEAAGADFVSCDDRLLKK